MLEDRKRMARRLAALSLAAPLWLFADSLAAGDLGKLSGTIIFSGPRPAAKAEPVTKDHATCGKSKTSQELIVGSGGGLKNAVVYLRGAKGEGKPKSPPVIDQKQCVFLPHVQATVVGSTLELRNSDGVLHNVNGKLPDKSVAFNVAMPMKGQKIKKKLNRAGLLTLSCDAGHMWMSAYIHVFEHGYFAVTGDSGSFSMADVPPGRYELVVWHEKLGQKSQSITVPPAGAQPIKVTF
jgi:plastocyanin